MRGQEEGGRWRGRERRGVCVCARTRVTACLSVCVKPERREGGGGVGRGREEKIGSYVSFERLWGWEQGNIVIQVPHAFRGMPVSTIGTLFALRGCSEHSMCSLCILKKG